MVANELINRLRLHSMFHVKQSCSMTELQYGDISFLDHGYSLLASSALTLDAPLELTSLSPTLICAS